VGCTGQDAGITLGSLTRRRLAATSVAASSHLEVIVTVTHDNVVRWIQAFADAIAQNKDPLTDLDSAIGDADHGINMNRGMTAVVAKLDGDGSADIGALLKTVGMTLVSSVGGAGGPLYGTLFLRMGTAADGKDELTDEDWVAMVAAGVEGVQSRGKAEPNDKTMVDALIPARDALGDAVAAGEPFADALRAAAAAAEEGMKATIPLVARKGRASYLGERSAGHQDPGATSSWLLMRTAAETFGDHTD
jgi:dihydroxyacetone kinase-like protein